jgi:hypothetical protein
LYGGYGDKALAFVKEDDMQCHIMNNLPALYLVQIQRNQNEKV